MKTDLIVPTSSNNQKTLFVCLQCVRNNCNEEQLQYNVLNFRASAPAKP